MVANRRGGGGVTNRGEVQVAANRRGGEGVAKRRGERSR